MGTTISTIHAYTTDPIPEVFGEFQNISEEWQSLIPDYEDCDFEAMHKTARKLSKAIEAPVLWFWEYDSDEMGFALLQAGKQVSRFSTDEFEQNKGLFKIPQLVGYPEGNKRRISRILSCGDIDDMTEMLEEFFGVPLCCDRDILLSEPELLIRSKGDERFRAFAEEEKRLRGKTAPFELRLREEIPGKLFHTLFGAADHRGRASVYYYGYRDESSWLREEALSTVRFENGRLQPISQEEFDSAPYLDPGYESPYFSHEYYPKIKVTFEEEAPTVLAGKSFVLPSGYFAFDIFGEDKLFLNGRNSLAVMDGNGQVIAKMSVKGNPVEMKDGYVLTVSGGSFGMYFHEPKAMVRIYEILDKTQS